MWKSLENLLIYAKVAPFPHCSALSFGLATLFLLKFAEKQLLRRNYFGGMVWGFMALFFLFITLFAEADARSRFQEYQRVRDLLQRYGWNRRFIKPISRSRCQRDAIQVAAERAGYKTEVIQFYRDRGYRWYHIIPDALLKDPRNFFTYSFIRGSFFVRNYSGLSEKS